MSKKVVAINTDYAALKLHQQEAALKHKKKKNRPLGALLIPLIALCVIISMSLMSEYQNLQKKEALEATYIAKRDALKNEVKTKEADIKKLNNADFIEKYARSKYQYTKDGETVFQTPDLYDSFVDNAATKAADAANTDTTKESK
jgi:cell division protein DivIC